MPAEKDYDTKAVDSDNGVAVDPVTTRDSSSMSPDSSGEPEEKKKMTVWDHIKQPGSAPQIVIAALLAIAIGLPISTQVDNIPDAAIAILGIPGQLWLRALTAVVLPLIITAMILAMQRLKEMSNGGHILARWTIGYYVLTTLIAIVHSTLFVSLLWRRLMSVAGEDALTVDDPDDQEMIDERSETEIHEVVVQMFQSLIPGNIFQALAENSLLAILVTSVVVGGLLKPGSHILKAVVEIEQLVIKVVSFLILLAPYGVFFLILPNLFRLDIADIGQNLGVLIGASLFGIFLHLFLILPLIYFCIMRQNPYTYWFKNSPAWVTAWGTASSAATLPVTMKCMRARGWPETVIKFAVPLGCLVNMDGTAIYFPAVVVFMAETQGIRLNGAEYTIVVLLATLASIGTTPIPSSSLVLTVMICQSVGVPITGMYAVVVAIDWFIDRFRTMCNVSGDMFAAGVITKLSKIRDPEGVTYERTEEDEARETSRV